MLLKTKVVIRRPVGAGNEEPLRSMNGPDEPQPKRRFTTEGTESTEKSQSAEDDMSF
jgi:hypothetical protein